MMKRALLSIVTLGLLLASSSAFADGGQLTPGGLTKVTHGAEMSGNGTVSSSLVFTPCGSANQAWVWNGSAYACATVGGGGLSGLTTGDLIIATSATTGGNFAGSDPGACTAGQADTHPALSAAGVLSKSCSVFVNAAGAGLSITGSTLSLPNVGPGASSYTYSSFTLDAQGRVTAASSGATPALASTTISAGTMLSGGGDLSANRTISLADIATNTVIGRVAAGTGAPSALTTIPTATMPALTGDVTTSAGAVATTISAGAVTLADMANLAQSTFIGRAAGAGTGVPTALSATQATAILNSFTATLQGLAPASGGGTTTFMRADGTWATPAGTGLTGSGSTGDLMAWSSGTAAGNFAGSTPSACAAGSFTTQPTIGATGAITNNCVATGLTGLTTNNVVKAGSATTIVNGWALDDATTWGVASKFTITEASGNFRSFGTGTIDGAATLSGGFTLGADSSFNSHKGTNIADGSSAQDVPAFHQIADAVNVGIPTGTTNALIKRTGSHAIGDGAFSDDGTTFGKASIWTVTESNGNEHTFGTGTIDGNLTAGAGLALITATSDGSAQHGRLSIPSNVASKGPLYFDTAKNTFNTTGDPTVMWGYNEDATGGKPTGSENGLGWFVEGDYNDGTADHKMESYLQYSSTASVTKRPIFFQLDRSTDALTTSTIMGSTANGFTVTDESSSTAMTVKTAQTQLSGDLYSTSTNFNIITTGATGNLYVKSNGGILYLNPTGGNGNVDIANGGGTTTIENALTINGATTANAAITDNKAVGSGLSSLNFTGANVNLIDTSAFAAGVGAGIAFKGKSDGGGTIQYAAGIKASKSNGVSADTGFDLSFGVLPNGGSVTEELRIASTGTTTMLGQGLGVGGLYQGQAQDVADVLDSGLIRRNLFNYTDELGNSGDVSQAQTTTANNGGWGFNNATSTIAYVTSTAVNAPWYPSTITWDAGTVGKITCTNGAGNCTTAATSDWRSIETSTNTGTTDLRSKTLTFSVWLQMASGTNASATISIARYSDNEKTSATCPSVAASGWTRCSVTKAFSSTSYTDNSELRVYIEPRSTTGMYVAGAQVEIGSVPTPYQPNDTSVGRGAEAYVAYQPFVVAAPSLSGTPTVGGDAGQGGYAYSLGVGNTKQDPAISLTHDGTIHAGSFVGGGHYAVSGSTLHGYMLSDGTFFTDGVISAGNSKNHGTITLSSGSGTATVASGATCVCSDTTAENVCKPSVSTTTLTVTGIGSDVINYMCW